MGENEDLNCLQIIGFEIICTKTDKMSQTTKPLRRYKDENKIVVNNWGVNQKEFEKQIFFAKG